MEKVSSGIIESVALGIYISVPFCRTKCSYCNFASDVFSRVVFERYVDRVCADIANAPTDCRRRWADGSSGKWIRSISAAERRRFSRPGNCSGCLTRCERSFGVRPDAEVTVECAPGTLTPEVLEGLLRCGVNRVSLGVQSFVDEEAAAVGRLHKRATVLDDIARLRAAGITNINIDLIAGLPHQTAESWQESLAETVRDRRAARERLHARSGRRLAAGTRIDRGWNALSRAFCARRRCHCGFLCRGLRSSWKRQASRNTRFPTSRGRDSSRGTI